MPSSYEGSQTRSTDSKTYYKEEETVLKRWAAQAQVLLFTLIVSSAENYRDRGNRYCVSSIRPCCSGRA